jgi:hypothetical protein
MTPENTTPPSSPTLQSFFSTDEENFNHETKWEAFDVMYEDDRLHLGAEYEEGVFEHANPCDAFDTRDLLERYDEWLADNSYLGGDGEYFSLFSEEGRAELDQLLRAWHDKHKPDVTLWKAVGRSITHTVTAEDLAEFHADNAGEGA